ncbi:MAG: YihY/virulence factor BrkB family protein [Syntrophotaleaceae bacterium]
MDNPKKNLDRIRTFFAEEIWNYDSSELGRWPKIWLRLVQVVSLAVRDFYYDKCLLRASALTYTTLLSIVPLLALMVAVLKGLGVQNVIEPLILERLAGGMDQVVAAIFRYIENTNFGRLGWLGLVFLVVSVLALLSGIEESFNHIWRVKETRTLLRRFSDYFSVVLLGPILILAAVSISTTLQSQVLLQRLVETAYVGEAIVLIFKLVPFLVMWAAFIFLYLFMPNTRVRFHAALVGGVVGGTIWQLVQWAYVHFQFGVAKYNAIYGTLAALPVFMIWLYMSWVIVLLGLELTYAVQNASTLRQELTDGRLNYASRQRVALTILVLVGEAFYRGNPPWTRMQLCNQLGLPARQVTELLDELLHLGLLVVVHGENDEDTGYQPGRPAETVEMEKLLQSLRFSGADCPIDPGLPAGQVVAEVERQLEESEKSVFDGMTLKDLVMRRVEGGRQKG